jgi:ABC-2 type transport system permease protein
MGFLTKFKALLKREFIGVSRNSLLLLIIILLPIAFGIMFASFRQIIPKSTPALVIPESEMVTQEELRFTTALLSFFSSPSIELDKQKAFDKLSREEVYFVVSTPKNIKSARGEVVIYVDNSLAPLSEVSDYVVETIKFELGQQNYYPTIRISKIGRPVMPLEFFVPGVIILLLAGIGLLLIPFSAIRDAQVIQRLLPQLSVSTLMISKIVFGFFLAIVETALLFLTQKYLEVPIMELNFWSVTIILITNLSLTSLGLAVIFLTKFSDASKYINALLFALIIVFSGVFYPVGFLPSYLQTVAKILPTYYAGILIRAFGIKGAGVNLFTDYILIVIGFFILSIALLLYSVWRFKNEK